MAEVHDLHSTLVDEKGEPIKQYMCKKGGIKAVHADLSRRVIENADDVRDSLRHGKKRRNIRDNGVNDTSSRSHVVYQLVIESSPIGGATPTEPTRKATLTFGNLYYLINFESFY